ncbi:hypothetical protein B0F90DRAFT_1717459 [Multifurca ochricompacta]|uniref:Protein transport protein BOS1 n=1 Tax=Multifurca ochricompacta TaxID=376703 RepID=A0AAD4M577_9AGAM|nr:hypothetical protein B0F90DRAFT_1717459 [Multifurca ochricompacta]
MSRTIDDYDSMARREIIKAKQEKATSRVQKFKTDYAEFRKEFERIKEERATAQRAELFSTSTGTPLTPDARRRFAPPSSTSSTFASSSSSSSSHPHLHNGTSSINSASENPFRNPSRDNTEVLDGLVDQRAVLKGTQRRLRDAANTLGLSRDVIGWIDRRSTQDMYIFWAGVVFTFFCFYLIWKYLG